MRLTLHHQDISVCSHSTVTISWDASSVKVIVNLVRLAIPYFLFIAGV